ncbi:hypothetical protein BU25DRAFT_423124 [Macroventuria anomochaeta]|uniref:Uncharacterized protein n=1 Tax=Macroventuria anomochaeta TaxID=301207 RepID=A0ACB6RUT3_9PLEO|nr:uncharacterized protein BU25DRAFT_423124 [Macroventuria anomochaeta]KAF2625806.1 hypothetical protein BU25DRAFT_423124 [Macroventuria anomochaeta]
MASMKMTELRLCVGLRWWTSVSSPPYARRLRIIIGRSSSESGTASLHFASLMFSTEHGLRKLPTLETSCSLYFQCSLEDKRPLLLKPSVTVKPPKGYIPTLACIYCNRTDSGSCKQLDIHMTAIPAIRPGYLIGVKQTLQWKSNNSMYSIIM